jgi:hypothetical protein
MINVGDIVCTRNVKGLPARLIRLRAGLLDEPNLVNHVIIVHHQAKNLDWIGLEGKPGGVGWTNLTKRKVLSSPWVITNQNQPKTEEQRFMVSKAAEKLLGTQYDWVGIAEEALLWADTSKVVSFINQSWGDGQPPEHVFCSNYADWSYDSVGIDSPGKKFDRTVSPNKWAQFILENSYA